MPALHVSEADIEMTFCLTPPLRIIQQLQAGEFSLVEPLDTAIEKERHAGTLAHTPAIVKRRYRPGSWPT